MSGGAWEVSRCLTLCALVRELFLVYFRKLHVCTVCYPVAIEEARLLYTPRSFVCRHELGVLVV